MLMVTPAALLRLRSETRSAVSLAPIKAAPARRLKATRLEAIIDLLARMMRRAEPTPFAVEGPARAAIRARLCESGWKWGQADAAADEAVQAALSRVGAERPTWQQGQPEHTQEAVLPILRENCARCGRPLPEDRVKYCDEVCAKAAVITRRERSDKEEARAKQKIYTAAWAEKHPRECKMCGKSFKPRRGDAKYCSVACGDDAFRDSRRKMRLVCEAVRAEKLS